MLDPLPHSNVEMHLDSCVACVLSTLWVEPTQIRAGASRSLQARFGPWEQWWGSLRISIRIFCAAYGHLHFSALPLLFPASPSLLTLVRVHTSLSSCLHYLSEKSVIDKAPLSACKYVMLLRCSPFMINSSVTGISVMHPHFQHMPFCL